MIRAAVEESDESNPIYVRKTPTSREDAIYNLHAFSNDRQRTEPSPNHLRVWSVPRFKACLGWLKLSGKDLLSLPWGLIIPGVKLSKMKKVEMQSDKEYFAIVYQYIPEGRNDPALVQSFMDFLWRAGFQFSGSPHRDS